MQFCLLVGLQAIVLLRKASACKKCGLARFDLHDTVPLSPLKQVDLHTESEEFVFMVGGLKG